mmetsp:Transcript_4991/g.15814  ORF Transcript_4991/g.15814 Transcript_4991/m.15814 type:complete len:363 (+) Transcript_4991:7119-8207(+)
MNLPVDGRWLVRFSFFAPAYSATAGPDDIFPTQSIGQPVDGDAIDMNLNGVKKTQATSPDLYGHKVPMEFTIEGQQLRYRFDFRSSSPVRRLHPFITSGEVILLRDRNNPPPLPPTAAGMGTLNAHVTDAVDGQDLAVGSQVSNGYVANAWTIAQEATLYVYSGSTLVTQLQFNRGSLEAQVPAGDYSCIALMPNFYAIFVKECDVFPKVTSYIGELALSPVLTPGTTRAVLSWGASPKDLDTYVTVPGSDASRTPCLVSYKSKKCGSGSTQVSLDLDSTNHNAQGGSPETTTFGTLVPARYIYRVNQYKGTTSDTLLASGAMVTFYSEDFQQKFNIGVDGYVEGINWFVFYIDGTDMSVRG